MLLVVVGLLVFSKGQKEGFYLPQRKQYLAYEGYLAAPGYRCDRSDCSNLHVKGVLTTGRLIVKATCPVKVEGREGREGMG